MKEITKWKADDGCEFSDETSCAAYDQLCETVVKVMAAFPPLPKNDGCDFAYGGGFMQLSEAVVTTVRGKLFDIIATRINRRSIEGFRDIKVSPAFVAKFIDGKNNRPLYAAWQRLSCIDSRWREWGQPYYAIHPDQGKQVMLASV